MTTALKTLFLIVALSAAVPAGASSIVDRGDGCGCTLCPIIFK